MIQTIKEILELRNIRNSCREFMTRDQSYIGIIRQFVWYFTVYRPREKKGLIKYLLFSDDKYKAFGYSLIDTKKGKRWISVGIYSSFRGQGLGTLIFSFLLREYKKPLYLEVLKTNILAIKLYKKLGFKIIEKKEKELVMKYER